MEDAWEWQTQPPNDTGKQVRHESFHIWKLLILGNIGAADCRLMELDTISMVFTRQCCTSCLRQFG